MLFHVFPNYYFFVIALAIDCGPLPVPQNGSLLGKMTVYPSILQFSCDEGFTLHGSSYRKCQTNGAWSGNSSFCKGANGILLFCNRLLYIENNLS